MTDEFVKIVFPLEVDEDGFPPIASESLNARAVEGGFILDNTPFFATGVGFGDVIEALPIPNQPGAFLFTNVVRSSGNKSISVIFLDHETVENVFQALKGYGAVCEYGEFGVREKLQMLAVSVPASCDYSSIAEYLAALEVRELLSYSELAL